MQEEYLNIQDGNKFEKVKEKLTEAWKTIRNTMPHLPESSTTSELAEKVKLI